MNPRVATLIELTDRVEAAIDAGDWTHAQELEAERRRLLEEVAAAPDAREFAPTFGELQARNYRLLGLVEHHKRRILREAAVAQTGHRGAAAYAEVRRVTAAADRA